LELFDETKVDDINNIGHCKGALSDVCGKNNFPAVLGILRNWIKDPILLFARDTRVKRQYHPIILQSFFCRFFVFL